MKRIGSFVLMIAMLFTAVFTAHASEPLPAMPQGMFQPTSDGPVLLGIQDGTIDDAKIEFDSDGFLLHIKTGGESFTISGTLLAVQEHPHQYTFDVANGTGWMFPFTEEPLEWMFYAHSVLPNGKWVDVEFVMVPATDETAVVSQVFAGTAGSNQDTYQLAFSGLLLGEFPEGETQLSAEQIAGMNVRGVVYNNIAGDSANSNHTVIHTATVTVQNGKLINIVFGGNVKTKAGASEGYTMTVLI